MTRKNLLIAIILLLLSVLLSFAPLSCEAAEPEQKVAVIPIEQLTTLEVELNRASKAISNSKAESVMLKQQLIDLQTALTEAQKQSAKLREQLQALKVTSTLQQTQLENANQSLQTLSVEMKKDRKNLERQRNVAYVIAAGMMYLAVKNA